MAWNVAFWVPVLVVALGVSVIVLAALVTDKYATSASTVVPTPAPENSIAPAGTPSASPAQVDLGLGDDVTVGNDGTVHQTLRWAWGGAFSPALSRQVSLSLASNTVSMTVEETRGNTGLSNMSPPPIGNAITSASRLPALFRPNAQVEAVVSVNNYGSNTNGVCIVMANGQVTVFSDANATQGFVGAEAGFFEFTMDWDAVL